MLDFKEYVSICEAIRPLHKGEKGIIVFDIDDTLLRVDSSMLSVYKRVPGSNKEIRLSTEELAKDPDTRDPDKASWYDYRDFQNPELVYQSIINGTPIIRNLRILDNYILAGYEMCFLTARACEDTIKAALSSFLKVRTKSGALQELGDEFNKTLSAAVNDQYKSYKGRTDAEKKKNVLLNLCRQYDKVIFVDDDSKNLRAAKTLNQDNLKIIKSQK